MSSLPPDSICSFAEYFKLVDFQVHTAMYTWTRRNMCYVISPRTWCAHTKIIRGKNPLTTPLSSCGTLTNSRQTLQNVRASDRNTNHRKTHLSQRRFQTTVRPKYNRKCFLTLPTTMVKRNCITIVKAMQRRLADEDPSFQSFHN